MVHADPEYMDQSAVLLEADWPIAAYLHQQPRRSSADFLYNEYWPLLLNVTKLLWFTDFSR